MILLRNHGVEIGVELRLAEPGTGPDLSSNTGGDSGRDTQSLRFCSEWISLPEDSSGKPLIRSYVHPLQVPRGF